VGFTSRSKKATLSDSGTLSVSRSSGSSSGLPSFPRQISADSSRSERADKTALKRDEEAVRAEHERGAAGRHIYPFCLHKQTIFVSL
jgi:hypothetical protein